MVFSSVQAAVLQLDSSGLLTGATGVTVNGNLYDVSFVDGTCAGLFGGCDQASDFVFQSRADASAASQALLDSVFVDTGSGSFDSVPSLTLGCGFIHSCDAITPFAIDDYSLSFFYAGAQNNAANWLADVTTAGYQLLGYDSSGSNATVFAVWNIASPVPEPETYAMLLAGLGFIGFMTLRRKQNFEA
jgi:hypothetical protein